MRKLKLHMQMSVDGFVAGPNGELDWMTWNMDDKITDFINELTDSSDTILLGRKMTDGFVSYWTDVLKTPESPEYLLAKKLVDTPKVVFSKTLSESPWANTTIAHDIVADVNALKQRDGRDIIVYGGAEFVSNLIKHDLIDEYHLFVNPVAIGAGMRIFGSGDDKVSLKLIDATPYECGVVVNKYEPVRRGK